MSNETAALGHKPTEALPLNPRPRPADAGLWSGALATADDTRWMAHWQGPRPVHIDLVVDEGECSAERLAGVMAGRFAFNHEPHCLPDPIDWLHNPSADIEWHILLHKGYYLAGLAREHRRCAALAVQDGLSPAQRSAAAAQAERLAARWVALIEGWMAQVPVGFIAADVTGRRVQNWIYSWQGFVAQGQALATAITPGFMRRMLASLHEQVEHLCAHLTPKRNHRTLELYAIYLAGVAFPEFERAAHWRAWAMAETAANVQADLGADGVHCELSTDYHCLALRNWMHVRRLATRHGHAVPAAFDEGLRRALRFALHVHQPDGGMPSWSDGDARGYTALLAEGAEVFGDASLRWAATGGAEGDRPQQRLACFANSGYVTWRSDWGGAGKAANDRAGQGGDPSGAQHLVLDCGPLGEGNHGHLDCLSFTLFGQGRPLLVDPGRCTYSEAVGPDGVNWRVRFRSTAAHNTVCVDGRSQTRYEPRPVKGPSRHGQGQQRHRIAGPAPEATLLAVCEAQDFVLLHGRADGGAMPVRHSRAMAGLDVGDGQWLWLVNDELGPLPAGSGLGSPGSPACTGPIDATAPAPAPAQDAPAPVREWAQHFQLSADAQGRTRLQALTPRAVDGAADGPLWLCHSPGLTVVQPVPAGADPGLAPGWVSSTYGQRAAAPQWRSVRRSARADFHTLIVPGSSDEPLLAQEGPVSDPVLGARVARLGMQTVWLSTTWAKDAAGRHARVMRLVLAPAPGAAESALGSDGGAGGVLARDLGCAEAAGLTWQVHTWLHASEWPCGAWCWSWGSPQPAAAPAHSGATAGPLSAPGDGRLAGPWLHLSNHWARDADGHWRCTAQTAHMAPEAQAWQGGRPLAATAPSPIDRWGARP